MTISTEGPTCPYCRLTITPDEAFFFSDRYSEQECPDCERKFKVEYHRRDSWISKAIEAVPPYCSDCPPVGYPTNETRCWQCPRPASPPPIEREG